MEKLSSAIGTMLSEFSRLCEAGDEAIESLKAEAARRDVSIETIVWLSIHFASCSFSDNEGLQIYLDSACERMGSNDPNT